MLGHPNDAARLLGAAAALRDRIGILRPAASDHLYEPLLSGLRAALATDALREALGSGWEVGAGDHVRCVIGNARQVGDGLYLAAASGTPGPD